MKTCQKCKHPKPETEFAIHRHCKGGRRHECKDCYNALAKIKYSSSPERIKAYRARTKAWRQSNPESCLNSRLKKTFGIGLSAYNKMLEQQKGCCQICNSPPGARRLGVDHDHQTGQVRGLLCGKCNVILGLSGDSTNILSKAIVYLNTHKRIKSESWIGLLSDEELSNRVKFISTLPIQSLCFS